MQDLPITNASDPASGTGGVFRNVGLPLGANVNDRPIISVENNLALYAGLRLLQQVLNLRIKTIKRGLVPSVANNTLILQQQTDALVLVNNILAGLRFFFTNGSGNAPVYNTNVKMLYAGVTKGPSTDGKHKYSYTTGPILDDPDGWAVDVQTWGTSVLLDYPELYTAMRTAYGSAFDQPLWLNLPALAGYQDASDKSPAGVGYGP
jgi:hypothetical protein